MSRDINVSGGQNTINVNYPTQESLNLESLSEKPIPVKFCDSEVLVLKRVAEERGIGVSKLIREIVRDHQSVTPVLQKLRELLNEV
jgi:hypothetical protein